MNDEFLGLWTVLAVYLLGCALVGLIIWQVVL